MRKQSRISESKENLEPRLEAEAQVVLCANQLRESNATQPSRRQSLPLPPLTLPQHSCSRIFDMAVKCRCNVFQISFCCAMCLDTGARCQIGTRIPKAAVFCWGGSRTEMFWSGLEAEVKPDAAPQVCRTSRPRVCSGSSTTNCARNLDSSPL